MGVYESDCAFPTEKVEDGATLSRIFGLFRLSSGQERQYNEKAGPSACTDEVDEAGIFISVIYAALASEYDIDVGLLGITCEKGTT
ncbi:hypothetical protein [Paenibacillus campinasensis]|uniref:Uncharacterized protein n=1 Tax=Paenibacillus campinasensis TaxID=66347 RepID=A0A268EPV8_9BACL|nr:hypothetical protein [Paenibacillus campinasensis]PAD75157.1 hypothetical protein CHH67_16185 [Paenibacillus campinasensis]